MIGQHQFSTHHCRLMSFINRLKTHLFVQQLWHLSINHGNILSRCQGWTVIVIGDRRDHVTPLLRDKLHWLRARERITFKLCLLVYKAINGLGPSYLQDLCVPVTTVSTHAALRSAARGDFVVPRTRRRLGNRAFCVAGPTAWNDLPSDIRTASSVTTFKNLLKTHSFIQSYYTT